MNVMSFDEVVCVQLLHRSDGVSFAYILSLGSFNLCEIVRVTRVSGIELANLALV
jgi:hypothetical protein